MYGENAVMQIGVRTRVIFMNNTGPILNGGALYLIKGMITPGAISHMLHLHTTLLVGKREQFGSETEHCN